MTPTQKKILFRTLCIGILWVRFCVGIARIGWAPGIIGFLTSACIAFRQGWNQQGMGLLSMIGGILTLLSFAFSSIPVYTSHPSLDLFSLDQIPTIGCIPNTTGSFTIDDRVMQLKSICQRKPLPVLVGQHIRIPTNTPLIISLGNGASFYSPGEAHITLQRTTSGYMATLLDGTGSVYPTPDPVAHHPLQSQLMDTYQRDRVAYLHKHYPWVREHAPGLTRIALWKMELLGLIDRSYRSSADDLRWYMQETTY